jgi:hypothetical protein
VEHAVRQRSDWRADDVRLLLDEHFGDPARLAHRAAAIITAVPPLPAFA